VLEPGTVLDALPTHQRRSDVDHRRGDTAVQRPARIRVPVPERHAQAGVRAVRRLEADPQAVDVGLGAHARSPGSRHE
jgi:hypothetical protein